MNHNKNLTILVSKTLKEYEGKELSDTLLYNIKNQLEKSINHYLGDNIVDKYSFPVEFENEFGEWELYDDGTLEFKARTVAKWIDINFTINKEEI